MNIHPPCCKRLNVNEHSPSVLQMSSISDISMTEFGERGEGYGGIMTGAAAICLLSSEYFMKTSYDLLRKKYVITQKWLTCSIFLKMYLKSISPKNFHESIIQGILR